MLTNQGQLMNYSEHKMEEFVSLLERHTPLKGLSETSYPELVTFRETEPHGGRAHVYEPGLAILGQGKSIVMWMDRNMITVPAII